MKQTNVIPSKSMFWKNKYIAPQKITNIFVIITFSNNVLNAIVQIE